MKTIDKILFAFLGIISTLPMLQAQSSLSTTGADVLGTGKSSVSYTVGQVSYLNFTESGGFHSNEGVQQPYEFYKWSIDTLTGVTFSCHIHPNPCTDKIILSVVNPDELTISYTLYDLLGRYIKTESISEDETIISIENLPAAAYLLTICNHQAIKTFKLIKTK